MALTLLDIARTKKDDFAKEVIETFAKECDISRKIPLETINTTEVSARRTNSVPDVGFRRRGESFGAVKGGGYDTVADAVFPMGANIDIDKADLRDKNPIEDPLATRTRETINAMTWKFNHTFINGDHGTDEDTFEGIKVRMANLPASQTVYGTDSTTAFDLIGAITANTTATLNAFMDKVDAAIYACNGHTADVCLTYADSIAAFKAALRRLNLYKDIEPTKPEVNPSNQRRSGNEWDNRPVFRYNGVDFFDMGLDRTQTTPIVGTDTVGGVACRPFYFLKLGKPYFSGIQQYAMEVTKPFMMPDAVTWRTVVDWPVGLRNVHTSSGSVLKGVKVAV